MVATWLLYMLAVLPFLLLFFLVVGRRWHALKAMPAVWVITVLILFFVWKVNFTWISASFLKGVFTAGEIVLIIFGAVWVVEIIKEKKHMADLQSLLGSISGDARVQVIIIAWLFGSLIEGVAGFGTPAMLAAPLLVSLGFAPVLAVVVALIANSTAVSFGAAGLPISLGIGSLGFDAEILESLTRSVASLHLIGSLIIPFALVWFVVSYSNARDKWKKFFEVVPFCIFAWFVFIVPYFLVAWFVGPELPSIIGGMFSLLVVSLAAKFGFLTPRNELRFVKKQKVKKESSKSLFLVLTPYFLIVLLLFLSRVVPFFREKLSFFSIGWENILGVGLSYKFLPFYTPAFYFFVSGFVASVIYRASFKEVGFAFGKTWKRVRLPALALMFALALVQLFLVSGNNLSGVGSMPLVLGSFVSGVFGRTYGLVSPFIGMFGAFLAGSNTVSNLLFGSFQAETARLLGMSLILILSLQVVGGAVGNMIAIHNVIVASSTVGLYGQEGKIIRKTILVSLLYALIVGVAGFLLFVIT